MCCAVQTKRGESILKAELEKVTPVMSTIPAERYNKYLEQIVVCGVRTCILISFFRGFVYGMRPIYLKFGKSILNSFRYLKKIEGVSFEEMEENRRLDPSTSPALLIKEGKILFLYLCKSQDFIIQVASGQMLLSFRNQ